MFHSNRTISTLLNKATLLALALAGTLAMGGAFATAAHAQSARFNIQQVGDALTSYGKNTVTQNGQTYYSVPCGHDPWKSSVIVSLSPNKNVIWLELDLVELPQRVSTTALAKLLEKNTDLGPVFFSIYNNRLRISSPLPNYDMSEAKLKGYLENLVNTAVDNHPFWDPRVLEVSSELSDARRPGDAMARNAAHRSKPSVQQ